MGTLGETLRSVASSQNTGWFQLLSLNCSSLCHQRVGSYFAPSPPCPVLCAVGVPCSSDSQPGIRPLLSPLGAGSQSQHAHRGPWMARLWGRAQSRRHHKIVFLWIGDFTLFMDFAFSFIKYCLRENAWKCSPAK